MEPSGAFPPRAIGQPAECGAGGPSLWNPLSPPRHRFSRKPWQEGTLSRTQEPVGKQNRSPRRRDSLEQSSSPFSAPVTPSKFRCRLQHRPCGWRLSALSNHISTKTLTTKVRELITCRAENPSGILLNNNKKGRFFSVRPWVLIPLVPQSLGSAMV